MLGLSKSIFQDLSLALEAKIKDRLGWGLNFNPKPKDERR